MDKAAEAKVSAHLGDKVSGPMSDGLVGKTFSYSYPSGIGYKISFATDTVYFLATIPGLTMNQPKKPVALPYLARKLRDNMFLAHWMIAAREGHVTLIFDLDKKQVWSAALMPGKTELFETTTIDEMTENEEGALYKEL